MARKFQEVEEALNKVLHKSTSEQRKQAGIEQYQQLILDHDFHEIWDHTLAYIEARKKYFHEQTIVEFLENVQELEKFSNRPSNQHEEFMTNWKKKSEIKFSKYALKIAEFEQKIYRAHQQKLLKTGFHNLKFPLNLHKLELVFNRLKANKERQGLDGLKNNQQFVLPYKGIVLQRIERIIKNKEVFHKSLFIGYLKHSGKNKAQVMKELFEKLKKSRQREFLHLLASREIKKDHLQLPLVTTMILQRKHQQMLSRSFQRWLLNRDKKIKKRMLTTLIQNHNNLMRKNLLIWKKQAQLLNQKEKVRKVTDRVKGKIVLQCMKKSSGLTQAQAFQKWHILSNLVDKSILQFAVFSKLTPQNVMWRFKTVLDTKKKKNKKQQWNQGLLSMLMIANNLERNQLRDAYEEIKNQRLYAIEEAYWNHIDRQKAKVFGRLLDSRLVQLYRLIEKWKHIPDLKHHKNLTRGERLSNYVLKKYYKQIQLVFGSFKEFLLQGDRRKKQIFQILLELTTQQHYKAFFKWYNLTVYYRLTEQNAEKIKLIKQVSQILTKKVKPQAQQIYKYGLQNKRLLFLILESTFNKKERELKTQAMFLLQKNKHEQDIQEQILALDQKRLIQDLEKYFLNSQTYQMKSALHKFKQNSRNHKILAKVFQKLASQSTRGKAILLLEFMKKLPDWKAKKKPILLENKLDKLAKKRLRTVFNCFRTDAIRGDEIKYKCFERMADPRQRLLIKWYNYTKYAHMTEDNIKQLNNIQEFIKILNRKIKPQVQFLYDTKNKVKLIQLVCDMQETKEKEMKQAGFTGIAAHWRMKKVRQKLEQKRRHSLKIGQLESFFVQKCNLKINQVLQLFYKNWKQHALIQKLFNNLTNTNTVQKMQILQKWKALPDRVSPEDQLKTNTFYMHLYRFYKTFHRKRVYDKLIANYQRGTTIKFRTAQELVKRSQSELYKTFKLWQQMNIDAKQNERCMNVIHVFDVINNQVFDQSLRLFIADKLDHEDQNKKRQIIEMMNRGIYSGMREAYRRWREAMLEARFQEQMDDKNKEFMIEQLNRFLHLNQRTALKDVLHKFDRNSRLQQIMLNFYHNMLLSRTGQAQTFLRTLQNLPDFKQMDEKNKAVSRVTHWLIHKSSKDLKNSFFDKLVQTHYDAVNKKRQAMQYMVLKTSSQLKQKMRIWQLVTQEQKHVNQVKMVEKAFHNIDLSLKESLDCVYGPVMHRREQSQQWKLQQACQKMILNSENLLKRYFLIWNFNSKLAAIEEKLDDKTKEFAMQNLDKYLTYSTKFSLKGALHKFYKNYRIESRKKQIYYRLIDSSYGQLQTIFYKWQSIPEGIDKNLLHCGNKFQLSLGKLIFNKEKKVWDKLKALHQKGEEQKRNLIQNYLVGGTLKLKRGHFNKWHQMTLQQKNMQQAKLLQNFFFEVNRALKDGLDNTVFDQQNEKELQQKNRILSFLVVNNENRARNALQHWRFITQFQKRQEQWDEEDQREKVMQLQNFFVNGKNWKLKLVLDRFHTNSRKINLLKMAINKALLYRQNAYLFGMLRWKSGAGISSEKQKRAHRLQKQLEKVCHKPVKATMDALKEQHLKAQNEKTKAVQRMIQVCKMTQRGCFNNWYNLALGHKNLELAQAVTNFFDNLNDTAKNNLKALQDISSNENKVKEKYALRIIHIANERVKLYFYMWKAKAQSQAIQEKMEQQLNDQASKNAIENLKKYVMGAENYQMKMTLGKFHAHYRTSKFAHKYFMKLLYSKLGHLDKLFSRMKQIPDREHISRMSLFLTKLRNFSDKKRSVAMKCLKDDYYEGQEKQRRILYKLCHSQNTQALKMLHLWHKEASSQQNYLRCKSVIEMFGGLDRVLDSHYAPLFSNFMRDQELKKKYLEILVGKTQQRLIRAVYTWHQNAMTAAIMEKLDEKERQHLLSTLVLFQERNNKSRLREALGKFKKHSRVTNIGLRFFQGLMKQTQGQKYILYKKWEGIPNQEAKKRSKKAVRSEHILKKVGQKNVKRAFQKLVDDWYEGDAVRKRILMKLAGKYEGSKKRALHEWYNIVKTEKNILKTQHVTQFLNTLNVVAVQNLSSVFIYRKFMLQQSVINENFLANPLNQDEDQFLQAPLLNPDSKQALVLSQMQGPQGGYPIQDLNQTQSIPNLIQETLLKQKPSEKVESHLMNYNPNLDEYSKKKLAVGKIILEFREKTRLYVYKWRLAAKELKKEEEYFKAHQKQAFDFLNKAFNRNKNGALRSVLQKFQLNAQQRSLNQRLFGRLFELSTGKTYLLFDKWRHLPDRVDTDQANKFQKALVKFITHRNRKNLMNPMKDSFYKGLSIKTQTINKIFMKHENKHRLMFQQWRQQTNKSKITHQCEQTIRFFTVLNDKLRDGTCLGQVIDPKSLHENKVKEQVLNKFVYFTRDQLKRAFRVWHQNTKISQLEEELDNQKKVELIKNFEMVLNGSTKMQLRKALTQFKKNSHLATVLKNLYLKLLATNNGQKYTLFKKWKYLPEQTDPEAAKKASKFDRALMGLFRRQVKKTFSNLEELKVKGDQEKRQAVFKIVERYQGIGKTTFFHWRQIVNHDKHYKQSKNVIGFFTNLNKILAWNFQSSIVQDNQRDMAIRQQVMEKWLTMYQSTLRQKFYTWHYHTKLSKLEQKKLDKMKQMLINNLQEKILRSEKNGMRQVLDKFYANLKLRMTMFRVYNKMQQGLSFQKQTLFNKWRALPLRAPSPKINIFERKLNNLVQKRYNFPLNKFKKQHILAQQYKLQICKKMVLQHNSKQYLLFYRWKKYSTEIRISKQCKEVGSIFDTINKAIQQNLENSILQDPENQKKKEFALQRLFNNVHMNQKDAFQKWKDVVQEEVFNEKMTQQHQKFLLDNLQNAMHKNQKKDLREVLAKFSKYSRVVRIQHRFLKKLDDTTAGQLRRIFITWKGLPDKIDEEATKRTVLFEKKLSEFVKRKLRKPFNQFSDDLYRGNNQKSKILHKLFDKYLNGKQRCFRNWHNKTARDKLIIQCKKTNQFFQAVQQALSNNVINPLIKQSSAENMKKSHALKQMLNNQENMVSAYFRRWLKNAQLQKQADLFNDEIKQKCIKSLNNQLLFSNKALLRKVLHKFFKNSRIHKIQLKFFQNVLLGEKGKALQLVQKWKDLPEPQDPEKMHKCQKFQKGIALFITRKVRKDSFDAFLSAYYKGRSQKLNILHRLFNTTESQQHRALAKWRNVNKTLKSIEICRSTINLFTQINLAVRSKCMAHLLKDDRTTELKRKAAEKMVQEIIVKPMRFNLTRWRNQGHEKKHQETVKRARRKRGQDKLKDMLLKIQRQRRIAALSKFYLNSAVSMQKKKIYNRMLQTKFGAVYRAFFAWKTLPENLNKDNANKFEKALKHFADKKIRQSYDKLFELYQIGENKKYQICQKINVAHEGKINQMFHDWRHYTEVKKQEDKCRKTIDVFSILERSLQFNIMGCLDEETHRHNVMKQQVLQKIQDFHKLKVADAFARWREACNIERLQEQFNDKQKEYFIQRLGYFSTHNKKRQLRDALYKFEKNSKIKQLQRNLLNQLVSSTVGKKQQLLSMMKALPDRIDPEQNAKNNRFHSSLYALYRKRMGKCHNQMKQAYYKGENTKLEFLRSILDRTENKEKKFFKLWKLEKDAYKNSLKCKLVISKFQMINEVMKTQMLSSLRVSKEDQNLKQKVILKFLHNSHYLQKLYFLRWREVLRIFKVQEEFDDQQKQKAMSHLTLFMQRNDHAQLREVLNKFRHNYKIENVLIKFFQNALKTGTGKQKLLLQKMKDLPEKQDPEKLKRTNKFEKGLRNIANRQLRKAFNALDEEFERGANKKRQALHYIFSGHESQVQKAYKQWHHQYIQDKTVRKCDKIQSLFVQLNRITEANFRVMQEDDDNQVKTMIAMKIFERCKQRIQIYFQNWKSQARVMKIQEQMDDQQKTNMIKFLKHFLDTNIKENQRKTLRKFYKNYKIKRIQIAFFKKVQEGGEFQKFNAFNTWKNLPTRANENQIVLLHKLDKMIQQKSVKNTKKILQAFQEELYEGRRKKAAMIQKIFNKQNLKKGYAYLIWKQNLKVYKNEKQTREVTVFFQTLNRKISDNTMRFGGVFDNASTQLQEKYINRLVKVTQNQLQVALLRWRAQSQLKGMQEQFDNEQKKRVVKNLLGLLDRLENNSQKQVLEKFHKNTRIRRIQLRFFNQLMHTGAGETLKLLEKWKNLPQQVDPEQVANTHKFHKKLATFAMKHEKKAFDNFKEIYYTGINKQRQCLSKLLARFEGSQKRFFHQWNHIIVTEKEIKKCKRTQDLFEILNGAIVNNAIEPLHSECQANREKKKRACRRLMNAGNALLEDAFQKWRRENELQKREHLEAMNKAQKAYITKNILMLLSDKNSRNLLYILGRFKKNAHIRGIMHDFFEGLQTTKTGQQYALYHKWKALPEQKNHEKIANLQKFHRVLVHFTNRKLRKSYDKVFKDSYNMGENTKRRYIQHLVMNLSSGQARRFRYWKNLNTHYKNIQQVKKLNDTFFQLNQTISNNVYFFTKQATKERQEVFQKKERNMIRLIEGLKLRKKLAIEIWRKEIFQQRLNEKISENSQKFLLQNLNKFALLNGKGQLRTVLHKFHANSKRRFYIQNIFHQLQQSRHFKLLNLFKKWNSIDSGLDQQVVENSNQLHQLLCRISHKSMKKSFNSLRNQYYDGNAIQKRQVNFMVMRTQGSLKRMFLDWHKMAEQYKIAKQCENTVKLFVDLNQIATNNAQILLTNQREKKIKQQVVFAMIQQSSVRMNIAFRLWANLNRQHKMAEALSKMKDSEKFRQVLMYQVNKKTHTDLRRVLYQIKKNAVIRGIQMRFYKNVFEQSYGKSYVMFQKWKDIPDVAALKAQKKKGSKFEQIFSRFVLKNVKKSFENVKDINDVAQARKKAILNQLVRLKTGDKRSMFLRWHFQAHDKTQVLRYKIITEMFGTLQGKIIENITNTLYNNQAGNFRLRQYMKKQYATRMLQYSQSKLKVSWLHWKLQTRARKAILANKNQAQLPFMLEKMYNKNLTTAFDKLKKKKDTELLTNFLNTLWKWKLVNSQKRTDEEKKKILGEAQGINVMIPALERILRKNVNSAFYKLKGDDSKSSYKNNVEKVFSMSTSFFSGDLWKKNMRFAFSKLRNNVGETKINSLEQKIDSQEKKGKLAKLVLKKYYILLHGGFAKWTVACKQRKTKVLLLQLIDVERVVRKKINNAFKKIIDVNNQIDMAHIYYKHQRLDRLINRRKMLVLKKLQNQKVQSQKLQLAFKRMEFLLNKNKRAGYAQLKMVANIKADYRGVHVQRLAEKYGQIQLRKNYLEVFKTPFLRYKLLKSSFNKIEKSILRSGWSAIKAKEQQYIQLRKTQSLFKFAEMNYMIEQFLQRESFQIIKHQQVKKENPWAKKAIHYLAKNQPLNLQVSLFRLRDYKEHDQYQIQNDGNQQSLIFASPANVSLDSHNQSMLIQQGKFTKQEILKIRRLLNILKRVRDSQTMKAWFKIQQHCMNNLTFDLDDEKQKKHYSRQYSPRKPSIRQNTSLQMRNAAVPSDAVPLALRINAMRLFIRVGKNKLKNIIQQWKNEVQTRKYLEALEIQENDDDQLEERIDQLEQNNKLREELSKFKSKYYNLQKEMTRKDKDLQEAYTNINRLGNRITYMMASKFARILENYRENNMHYAFVKIAQSNYQFKK